MGGSMRHGTAQKNVCTGQTNEFRYSHVIPQG
jgi:hypothetical protein